MSEAIQNIKDWVQSIFTQTDAVEDNRIGPLSRDRKFLSAINKLMGSDRSEKRNSLFLLKISATTTVEVCHRQISINHKFPVLEQHDFTSFSVLSVPKAVNGHFFELNRLPEVVAWSDKVYSFSREEYSRCKHHTRHTFCQKPNDIQNLVENVFLV